RGSVIWLRGLPADCVASISARSRARVEPRSIISTLKQAKTFRGGPKMVVAPEGLFADGPILSLAQPAEMKIDFCGVKRSSKFHRPALRPAGALILAFTMTRDFLGPMFAFRQCRQIDFARGDGRRFPVHHEQALVSNQDSLGVEFAMNNRWPRRQQRGEPGVAGFAEFPQPEKAAAQWTRKLEGP